MSVTLRFISEDLVNPDMSSRRWFGMALARDVARVSPPDYQLESVSAHGHGNLLSEFLIESACFGGFRTSFFSSPILRAAWEMGFPLPTGFGLTHAPTLLAPLFPHDHANDPGSHAVVTLHDLADLADESRRHHRQQKRLLRHAWNHADALIVPNHTLAEQVNEYLNFGNRIHVVGRSPLVNMLSTDEIQPVESSPQGRKTASDYLTFVIDENDLGGVTYCLDLMATPEFADGTLVIIDRRAPVDRRKDVELHQRINTVNPNSGRVVYTAPDTIAEYATLLKHSSLTISTDRVAGHTQSVIDSWALKVPCLALATPTHVELAAGSIALAPIESTVFEFAQIADKLLRDKKRRGILRATGIDALNAYDAIENAQLIWDLHADLANA